MKGRAMTGGRSRKKEGRSQKLQHFQGRASDFVLAGLDAVVVFGANPVHATGLAGTSDDFRCNQGAAALGARSARSSGTLLSKACASCFTDFFGHCCPPFDTKTPGPKPGKSC